MIDRVRLSEDGGEPPLSDDDEPTNFRPHRSPTYWTKMAVRVAVIVAVLAVASSWAAPKQGKFC